MDLFKFLVLMLFLGIILSLASGVFFLAKDKSSGVRVVTSLSFRVFLSILLFALLLFGFVMGWIEPNNVVTTNIQK